MKSAKKFKLILAGFSLFALAAGLPMIAGGAGPTMPPPTNLVDANFNSVNIGNLATGLLNISGTGVISSPKPNGNAVKFSDSEGIEITATSPWKGIILNNNLGGMTINSTGGGQTINAQEGGLTVNHYGGGITVKQLGNFSNPGGITVRGGGINLNGLLLNELKIPKEIDAATCAAIGGAPAGGSCKFPIFVKENLNVMKDLDVSGHIRAAGIGKYVTYSATSADIPAGEPGTVSKGCDKNEQIVSCGFLSSEEMNVYELRPRLTLLGFKCTASAKNNGALPHTLQVYTTCFNSDS